MSARDEFRRGWPTLVTAFVGVGVGAQALLFFALPHFAQTYATSYGWSRSEMSGAATIFMATMFFSVPAAGVLSNRLGVRRTLLASIVLGALVIAAFPLVYGKVVAFYGLVVALAVAGAATNAVLYSRALAAWFDEARGFAFGLMMTGAGVAATLVPICLTYLIERYGAPAGWWGLAAVSLLAFPLCYFVLKRRSPADSTYEDRVAATGVTLMTAVSSFTFWLIVTGTLLLAGTAAGVAFHIRLMLTDVGVAPMIAASIAGAMGVGSIVARLVAGFLVDRLHAPFVGAGLCMLAAIGCFGLLQYGATFALTSVLLVSVALGAEAELIGFMCSRYFGLRAYAAIYGVAYGALALGSGLSPLVYGLIYDHTGGYTLALTLGTCGAIAAAACYACLGPYRFRSSESADNCACAAPTEK